MGPVKVVCSLLILGVLHLVASQSDPDETICRVLAYYPGNGIFRQVSSISEVNPELIRLYPICCPGYVFYNNTPDCDRECPSGSCIYGYCPPDDEAINCKCYDDVYYPFTDSECIPVCEPGQDSECTCHAGYTKDTRTNFCVPTECFHRCTNGKCDKLGTCTCDENFAKHTKRTGLCVPQNCIDNCRNGWCSGNGTCNCDIGYKNIDDQTCERIVCPSFDSTDALFCKSDCESKCNNGTCSDEGACICNAGFRTSPEDHFLCTKISCPSADSEETIFCKSECDARCTNGACTDDGVCNCNKGFKTSSEDPYTCNEIICPSSDADDSVYCKEKCESSCTNGACNDEGACNCAPGFKSSAEDRFTCIEIHCPSSAEDDVGFCKADCETKCTKGKCSIDGSCSCLEGYKKGPDDRFACTQIRCPATDSEDNEFCKALCEGICVNGICSDAGNCNDK